MPDALRETIARNRAGEQVALPSVCSAHPVVLEAACRLAEDRDRPVLIEATSNQVNQDGGYTGLRPRDFVAQVEAIADRAGCDRDRITFGGDHLGPQAWKHLPAEDALTKADEMVQAYVRAGITKIHLDCSEGCAGEPAQLSDETVANRAARLAHVCEIAAPDADRLAYIVGTEVPPPGGARDCHVLRPTDPAAARATLATHQEVFDDAAAGRITGLVVQPGVEFGALSIDHLPEGPNAPLRAVLDDVPGVVFEAHSTDYQLADAFPRMAEMGFAIQKVGPALTFAYREAVYALDVALDLAQGTDRTAESPRAALETAMLADPSHWKSHYRGTLPEQYVLRHFAWSDRIRYYWPVAGVVSSVAELRDAVDATRLPAPLLRQVLSEHVLQTAEAVPLTSVFDRITQAAVQVALAPYFFPEVSR